MKTVGMLLENGAVATAENYSGETAYVLTRSPRVRIILEGEPCGNRKLDVSFRQVDTNKCLYNFQNLPAHPSRFCRRCFYI